MFIFRFRASGREIASPLGLLLVALFASVASARPPATPLVLSGDSAPGGGSFSFPRDTALSADGHAVFSASVVQGASFVALYRDDGVGLTRVIGPGDVTAGMPVGTTVERVSGLAGSEFRTNRSGDVALAGVLAGTGVTLDNDSAVWGPGPGGGLTMLAREGDPAPGVATSGVIFERFDDLFINDLGQVVFVGTLQGPGIDQDNSQGLWATTAAGVLELRLRGGDTHDDLPATAFCKTFSDPKLDSADVLAFSSSLRGSSVVSGNAATIWGNDGFDALVLLARQGSQVPGGGMGVDLVSAGSPAPAINSMGEAAMVANLQGFAVAAGSNRAVFGPDATGTFTILARKGFAGPASNPGQKYLGLSFPVLNEAGEIAFVGSLQGPGLDISNSSFAFGPDESGDLTALLQQGQQLSDLPLGVTPAPASGPALSSFGGVVTDQFVVGPGVTSNNDRALIYSEAPSEPRVIVRTGDVLEVAPGDMRTVDSYQANLLPDTHIGVSPFDEQGGFVATLIFTDNSNGSFVFQLPEPSAAAAGVAALLSLSWLVRSRR